MNETARRTRNETAEKTMNETAQLTIHETANETTTENAKNNKRERNSLMSGCNSMAHWAQGRGPGPIAQNTDQICLPGGPTD